MSRYAPTPTSVAACLAAAALSLLAACNATLPAAPAQPAALPFASFGSSAEATVQGGALEAFAYSEKPGDAVLGQFVTGDGVARVTGVIGARSGSTWGGIALMAAGGPEGKTVDLSRQRTLHIQLASATATQLRVRVLGNDKATRDNGCYPVAVQSVTPELRDYTIALARFAPEAYCGAQGRSVAATAPAVVASSVTRPSSRLNRTAIRSASSRPSCPCTRLSVRLT